MLGSSSALTLDESQASSHHPFEARSRPVWRKLDAMTEIDLSPLRRSRTPSKRRLLRWLLTLAVVVMTACAAFAPERAWQPGINTRDDIVRTQGQPTRIWSDTDGGSTLEYATQPFGHTCWMFKLDAAGRLLSAQDMLLPAGRDQVQAGMTPEQVNRLLGRERSRVFFYFSGEDVWDWHIASDQTSLELRFNVHFIAGRVVRTSQSVVYRDRMRFGFGVD
jgi:hypothetical protein